MSSAATAESAVRDRMTACREQLTALLQDTRCGAAADVEVESGDVAERLAAITATASRTPILVLGRHERHTSGGAPGAIAYRALSLARVPVLMHIGAAS